MIKVSWIEYKSLLQFVEDMASIILIYTYKHDIYCVYMLLLQSVFGFLS